MHLSAKPPQRSDLPDASLSRTVEDHHLDRPEAQARRRAHPTGTNRPCGLFFSIRSALEPCARFSRNPRSPSFFRTVFPWWPWRGGNTRSHSEHGSEGPQWRGYCGNRPRESSAPPRFFFQGRRSFPAPAALPFPEGPEVAVPMSRSMPFRPGNPVKTARSDPVRKMLSTDSKPELVAVI